MFHDKCIEKNCINGYTLNQGQIVKERFCMIEAMVKSIASFLCKEEIIQEEKKDICRYGIEVIICNAISVLVIIIISILLDTIWQGILLLMIFGTLRICVGGYHAKTYYMCGVLFGLTYILTLVLFWWEKNNRQDHILRLFVLIGSFVVVASAPVKNVNRYITEEEEKRTNEWELEFI